MTQPDAQTHPPYSALPHWPGYRCDGCGRTPATVTERLDEPGARAYCRRCWRRLDRARRGWPAETERGGEAMTITRETVTAAARVAKTARGLARVLDLAPAMMPGPAVTVEGRLEHDRTAAGERAWWALVDRASQDLIDGLQVLAGLAGTREG